MPSVEVTTTVAQAGQIAAVFEPYLYLALALFLGPVLVKMGVRLIKSR